MKKGLLRACKALLFGSPHRSTIPPPMGILGSPCGSRSVQGLPSGYPHHSMIPPPMGILGSPRCSNSVLSMGSPRRFQPGYGLPSSLSLPTGDPPGYGPGFDSLAPADLSPMFTHDSNHDLTPCHGFPDSISPAVSLCHEKACIDTTADKLMFMKLYDVQWKSSKGKGHVQIDITGKPRDGSPAQPIFDNPTAGVQVVVDSVFRAQLTRDGKSTLFTSWVACPPCGSQETALCYTSGHAFAKGKYGLSYLAEGADFGWQSGTGCFGTLVKAKKLWGGLAIDTKPLAISFDIKEDFTCFQAACDADFLLPCSPDEVQAGGFVASFGYPCTEHFLQQAYEELVLKSGNYQVGDLYNNLATDADSLYGLLKDTFGGFTDGQLLCSPGILTLQGKNSLHIKSSTLIGASGSPIIPARLPGYTIGTHEGGTKMDTNIAISTDSPSFVHSYSKHVLPRLPSPSHAIFHGHDLEPFRRWLHKHGLQWLHDVDVEECFATPPARPIKWAI